LWPKCPAPSSPPIPLPSPSIPFLPPFSLSSVIPPLIPFPFPHPQIQLRNLGDRCKLPQWGSGSRRQRICMYFRLRNRRWWLTVTAHVSHSCETWHSRPICRRLHSRIWASPSPTPSQNLVGSTIGWTLQASKWSGPDPRSGWKSTLLTVGILQKRLNSQNVSDHTDTPQV